MCTGGRARKERGNGRGRKGGGTEGGMNRRGRKRDPGGLGDSRVGWRGVRGKRARVAGRWEAGRGATYRSSRINAR